MAWALALLLEGVIFAHADGAPPDSQKLLQLLQEKKAEEVAEFKRLSAMVRIPAGEFRMGSRAGRPDEHPVHSVLLGEFYIDKFEVTQLQYQWVMGVNPSYFRDCSHCPVEKVTFAEALEFCRRMNKTLPTEAQWEKAARGGTGGPFYWGDDFPENFAWGGNNSGQKTHSVGQKEPNVYGLYDVSGNVWEWVMDWYAPDYYRTSPKKNPTGPQTGSQKVVRGGSWGSVPQFLRHSQRDHNEPESRFITGGFRCAAPVQP